MGIEREEILSKGMDNLFNNTIVKNVPSLEKERDIQVQKSFRASN
jgi:hypothetical protein